MTHSAKTATAGKSIMTIAPPSHNYQEAKAQAKAAQAYARAQRPWFKKKRTIIPSVFVLFIIVVSVSSGDEGGPGAGPSAKSPVSAPPLELDFKTFTKEFDSNQVAAESKYNDQVVRLTSKISNITDSGLSFHGPTDLENFSMTQVSCDVSDANSLIPLKNGQSVTFQGEVSGQSMGVISLDNCVVIP
jgi:hypothetical protein